MIEDVDRIFSNPIQKLTFASRDLRLNEPMPQKSWLAKVSSVYDIDPGLYIWRNNRPHDEAREDRADRKRVAAFNKPLPIDPKFVRFFGSRMHDSWVMGIERTPQQLRVRLDSINADIFALDLIFLLGLKRVPTQWPVDLILHDPQFVRASQYDPDGNLRFALGIHALHRTSEGPAIFRR